MREVVSCTSFSGPLVRHFGEIFPVEVKSCVRTPPFLVCFGRLHPTALEKILGSRPGIRPLD